MTGKIPLNTRIDALVDCLVEHLHPKRILLFGSRARGDAQTCSDIDLAVDGALPASFREERKLREALDELAGSNLSPGFAGG